MVRLSCLTFYGPNRSDHTNTERLYETLSNKYFVDEYYDLAFITPLSEMAGFLWSVVDVLIIDGIVNGVGQVCKLAAGLTSFKMTGNIQRHAMVLVIGMVCLMTVL